MAATSKSWDFGVGDADTARRAAAKRRAREADMHVVLSEDARYAASHEGLRRMAELLVEGVEAFFDDAMRVQRTEAFESGEDLDALEAQKRDHVQRVCRIMLSEALKRVPEEPSEGD